MADFKVQIARVTTNGPYTYVIHQDGTGAKAAVGLATIGAALDAIKADLNSLIAGGVVLSATLTVRSEPS